MKKWDTDCDWTAPLPTLPPEFNPRDVPRRPVVMPGTRPRYDVQDVAPIILAVFIVIMVWVVLAVLAAMALGS